MFDPSLPLRFLRRVEPQPREWQSTSERSRGWESFYRDRWAHDRVVRSTHGVNCTGSCSWKIYVKDGIVAWVSQVMSPSLTYTCHEQEPVQLTPCVERTTLSCAQRSR